MPERGARVFICSLACRIRPEKQAEFLTSIQDLMERTRWLPGCFGCRLVAELGEPSAVTVVMEWADRESLDQFLRSTEYRIMLGMRILMEEEPRVSVDQVVTRTHMPTRES
jgi:quinol monooxygenase YgiN